MTTLPLTWTHFVGHLASCLKDSRSHQPQGEFYAENWLPKVGGMEKPNMWVKRHTRHLKTPPNLPPLKPAARPGCPRASLRQETLACNSAHFPGCLGVTISQAAASSGSVKTAFCLRELLISLFFAEKQHLSLLGAQTWGREMCPAASSGSACYRLGQASSLSLILSVITTIQSHWHHWAFSWLWTR